MDSLKILLTSQSAIKKSAVNDFFSRETKTIIIQENVNCDGCQIPPQPIDCGQHCAEARIDYAKKILKNTGIKYDDYLFVSIESDLSKDINGYQDCAHVRMELMGFVGTGMSQKIKCPVDTIDEFKNQKQLTFSDYIKGYSKSGGEFLAEIFHINPKNWMADLLNFDRKTQIFQALQMALSDLCNNVTKYYTIYNSYSIYKDFPKKGVDFKYFYSLFQGDNMNMLSVLMQKKYQYIKYDAILPLESRGLVLGALLADQLKTSMIPFQKPGKIPGEKISSDEYEKEYGKDEIVMSVDLFKELLTENKKFYRFLITDDLIATGGTIEAGKKILDLFAKKYNIEYRVDVLVLNEIPELRTKAVAKIGNDYIVFFRNIVQCYDIIQSFY